MSDCDDLHAEARDHVHLGTIAKASPVTEMHIDSAMFSETQARIAGQLREDN